MSDSCNPVDCSPQAPLSMEFSRQEYWSGLPFPSPGGLPDPGIEPRSPALQVDFFLPTKLQGKSPWPWSNDRLKIWERFFLFVLTGHRTENHTEKPLCVNCWWGSHGQELQAASRHWGWCLGESQQETQGLSPMTIRKWIFPTTGELGGRPQAPCENHSSGWHLDFSLLRSWAVIHPCLAWTFSGWIF